MLEYLWYTLAAVLAGVGTGLVGLSALFGVYTWSPYRSSMR